MKNCEICNEQFVPKNSRQKFCCKKCQLVYWKIKRREKKWNYKPPSVGIIKCKTCSNDFKPKINHPKYIYCSDECRLTSPDAKEYRKQWREDNPEKTLINQKRANAKRTKRMREDPVFREKNNKRNRERLAFRKESEPGFREQVAQKNKQFHIAFSKKNGKHYNTVQKQLLKKNNPEKYKEWRQKREEARKRKVAENPDFYKLKQSLKGKEYYYANKEKRQAAIKRYRDSLPEGTTARWTKAWAQRNPGKIKATGAAYRARKFRATPSWQTDEHRRQIEELYSTCPKDCDVDHIYPLQGKDVCGLHVPWNLEHLESKKNRSKGNLIDNEYFKEVLKKSNERWGFSGGGLV
jgi:hypothetical protein